MRTHDTSSCCDDLCPACESQAEARAADDEPEYDLDGAANQYERGQGL